MTLSRQQGKTANDMSASTVRALFGTVPGHSKNEDSMTIRELIEALEYAEKQGATVAYIDTWGDLRVDDMPDTWGREYQECRSHGWHPLDEVNGAPSWHLWGEEQLGHPDD